MDLPEKLATTSASLKMRVSSSPFSGFHPFIPSPEHESERTDHPARLMNSAKWLPMKPVAPAITMTLLATSITSPEESRIYGEGLRIYSMPRMFFKMSARSLRAVSDPVIPFVLSLP